MLVDVAYYLLFGAVLLAAWAACAFLMGGVLRRTQWTRSGSWALTAVLGCCLVGSVAVIGSVLRHDYSVGYVAEVSDRALPGLYKFTAFWAGMDGSMLLWLTMLAGYSVLAVRSARRLPADMIPWVGFTMSVSVLFFAGLVAFLTNPLERLAFVPEDGRGMNPALQNYWMAIHPPTLYLGYVGMSVPFAFAISALVTGRLGEAWIRTTRRWTLWGWCCLGVGMVFGGHWAYVELGWGGYWAWDPVENASFMPWLACTAYLHSVIIQEHRGMFKAWNVILVIAAYVLSIFGTFITRSGVVESIHSFARSPVGPWFLVLVVVLVAVSAGLVYYRWPQLRAAHRIDSLVSREFGFMLNNMLFMSICAVTLFLTMYPSLSEWATGERWTVGASAYGEINGTLGILLLVLTGVGPVIAWRRASPRSLRRAFLAPVIAGLSVAAGLFAAGFRHPMSLAAWGGAAFVIWCVLGEFAAGARVIAGNRGVSWLHGLGILVSRNRRRYGGYIVHLGIALLFIGVAGMAFREDAEAALAPGESVTVHGFVVRYAEAIRLQTAGADIDSTRLVISRDGKELADLRPEFKLHHKFPEPEKNVAIHETLAGDLYVVLAQQLDKGTDRAKFQVLWNPLVAWVWLASYVVVFGTLVCAWPERRQRAAGLAPL